MHLPHLSRRAVTLGAATAAAAALALGAAALPAASAAPAHRAGTAHARPQIPALTLRPVVPGSDYLALGDSVSFGYREPTTTPPPNYDDAASFVGYPEDVGAVLGLHVANLACPGETSSSFIEPTAQSNGCENHVGSNGQLAPGGYRTLFPLHYHYTGSQLDAALGYLRSHRDTRLVSLMIGANDGFVCEETTADHCTSPTELAALKKQIEGNVSLILAAIRHVYRGQIAIVDYYSLDYANPTDDATSTLLDQAMNDAARPYHVEIVNGYGAYEKASTYSAGDPCTAGLLTQLSTGGCGVHPTPAGQDVLAQAVETVIRK
jgi:lysophospholipase L1-like esterase